MEAVLEDETYRFTVKKGSNAEHASRPTLAIDAMAHRNAAWRSFAAKPEPSTPATCEMLIHRQSCLRTCPMGIGAAQREGLPQLNMGCRDNSVDSTAAVPQIAPAPLRCTIRAPRHTGIVKGKMAPVSGDFQGGIALPTSQAHFPGTDGAHKEHRERRLCRSLEPGGSLRRLSPDQDAGVQKQLQLRLPPRRRAGDTLPGFEKFLRAGAE
jgi:hypothetical protein